MFKVGSKVKCVRPRAGLVVGDVYTVSTTKRENGQDFVRLSPPQQAILLLRQVCASKRVQGERQMNNKAKQQWDKRAAECSNLFKAVKTGKVENDTAILS